jgi:hypothetical protein
LDRGYRSLRSLNPRLISLHPSGVLNQFDLQSVLYGMNKALSALFLILTLATGLHAQSEFSPQVLLKPRVSGPYMIPLSPDVRSAYDTLGTRAGINMVFHPGFKADIAAPVRVEGQTFFEAMDNLSRQTGNFWFAWDSKTIVVAADTPQYHRDLEPLTHKTFYLANSTTREALLNIVTALRTRHMMRGVMPVQGAQAIIVYDTASKVSGAEQVIAEMTNQALPISSSAPIAFPENSPSHVLLAESGKVRKVVPSNQAHMENMLVGSVSIDTSLPMEAIYEDLASRAGLNVVFDRSLRPAPTPRFHVEGVDLINALDLLALQTRTVWQPLNDSIIYVMGDNQQNRVEREQVIAKVIYLPELANPADLQETANALRTSPMASRSVFQDEKRKAILIKDTPLRVFLAEKVVADLNKRHGKTQSVAITIETSSLSARYGWMLGNAAKARPQLDVKLRNKTSVRLKENAKGAFEALTGLAGLQLSADSRFADDVETSFNAINIDILDALDLLGWKTRNIWQVVDQQTIRVLPDTQATRRDLETIEKTIVPADPSDAASLLNILRTIFQLRTVSLNEKNNIVIRDTADNVAIAEKLVEILGKGSVQR